MDSKSISCIDSEIDRINSLPVISGYYLVIGGGKIGNKFVEYAKKHELSFVLVVDVNCEAPASKNAKILRDKDNLMDVLSTLAVNKKDDNHQFSSYEATGHGSEVYFYCMDAKDIPSLLDIGIPEYIVPAIPSHAAVDIMVDLLRFDWKQGFVREVSIDEGDRVLIDLFEDMVAFFPADIIAGSFPEHGAIFLSYARSGEICPDNCKGQEGYCYTYKRVKPRTITSYVRELSHDRAGWVFESCQMGPGIGGIRGKDLRDNLVSVMRHLRQLKEEPSTPAATDLTFFIATTCNCHGILNMLQVI
ncbi:MAG: hypothetical protein SCH66_13150 [Methanolobus sp.]|nr:hypothetical protein [Methanolobus sp.]